MIRIGTALALAILGTGAVAADQQQKRIVGDWLLSIDNDPFHHGALNVIVLTVQGNDAMAIRCIAGDPSIALNGDYETGAKFSILFRVDRNPIIEATGTAVSAKLLAFTMTGPMLKQMIEGKEYSLRVTDSTTNIKKVFAAGQAAEALIDVVRECPFE